MNVEITMDLFTARLALRGMRLQLKLLKQTGAAAKHLRAKADELESVIALAEEELLREQAGVEPAAEGETP